MKDRVNQSYEVNLVVMKKQGLDMLLDNTKSPIARSLSPQQKSVEPQEQQLVIQKLDFKNQTAQIPKVSLGIDFTFNTIKNVKKVNWKEEAPWYREISDGFCWLAYCYNEQCPLAFE